MTWSRSDRYAQCQQRRTTGDGVRHAWGCDITEYEFDIFLSYAREDREPFVQQLAEQLRGGGYRVWYDQFELKLGDVIANKIEDGLSRSRYGVVILSPRFFDDENPWTQRELRVMQHFLKVGRLLPVLHDLTLDELPPTLSDIVHVRSTLGAESVMRQIAEVVGGAETATPTPPPPDRRPQPPIRRPEPRKRPWGKRDAQGRSRGRRRLIITAAVSLALLIGFVPLVWSDHGPRGAAQCRGEAESGGEHGQELVGITDGSCTLDKNLKSIEEKIKQQNDAARKTSNYRTVVFFASLSVSSPEHGTPLGMQQLSGIALAQEQANKAAATNSAKTPIQVLLANAGDRFYSGPKVAQQIVERARKDYRIIGVLGIGQSRDTSYQAIQTLSQIDLPIIATAVTGEAMPGSSNNFFRLSSGDERQAQVAAQYAAHVLQADEAIVIQNDDPSDYYSRDLAGLFTSAYKNQGGHVVDTCHYGEQSQAACDAKTGMTPDQLRAYLCTNNPKVVFYASRAQQFTALLGDLSGCGHKLRVLGSSDIPKFIANGQIHPQANLELHYLAYGAAKLSNCDKQGPDRHPWQTTEQCDFVRAMSSSDLPTPLPADNDSALGYDALKTVLYAIEQNVTINRGTILNTLSKGIDFDGATGRITLSAVRQSSRTPLNKPVFVLQLEAGGSTVQFSCGRFSRQDGFDSSRGLPCPVDQQ